MVKGPLKSFGELWPILLEPIEVASIQIIVVRIDKSVMVVREAEWESSGPCEANSSPRQLTSLVLQRIDGINTVANTI